MQLQKMTMIGNSRAFRDLSSVTSLNLGLNVIIAQDTDNCNNRCCVCTREINDEVYLSRALIYVIFVVSPKFETGSPTRQVGKLTTMAQMNTWI